MTVPLYGFAPFFQPLFVLSAVIVLVIMLIPVVWMYQEASRHGEQFAIAWTIGVATLSFVTVFGGYAAVAVYKRSRDE